MRCTATITSGELLVKVEGVYPVGPLDAQQLVGDAASAIAEWVRSSTISPARRGVPRGEGPATAPAPAAPVPPVVDVLEGSPHPSVTVVDVDDRAPGGATSPAASSPPRRARRAVKTTAAARPGTRKTVPAAAVVGDPVDLDTPQPAPPAPEKPTQHACRDAAEELLAAGVPAAVVAAELDLPLADVRAWKKEMGG
ncbi:hypothetical protein ACL02T_33115 [Pseudonocardia sp. RS010]|uniref:hypothetical protein n=1 Tax=Pseudonocardia sp. RS010 TaxID=3385979 RepID=UPI0039A2D5E2